MVPRSPRLQTAPHIQEIKDDDDDDDEMRKRRSWFQAHGL